MRNIGKIGLMIVFFCGFVSQTPAQTVLIEGKIPKDLIINLSFSSTVRFSAEYDLKITADGKVYLDDRSHQLPVQKAFNPLLLEIKEKKPKTPVLPKLRDKLSQNQLKQLILEFEKSGFFEMNESYYGDPNLKENTCWTHADTKALSISTNGKTRKVAFYLGCSYGENSPLKSFLSLYDKISRELSGVKKIDLKPQKTNAHPKSKSMLDE